MKTWSSTRSCLRTSLVALLALLPLLSGFASIAHAGTQDLVISQVYGGGGNAGAPYKNDFIELHNRSNTNTVSLTGYSVQYAATTGTSWQKTDLSGSIPPGGYYLIQEASGGANGVSLPPADATGGIPMALGAGKVALASINTLLSGSCPTGSVVDFVGYGAGTNCSETSPTATLSNTMAALRARSGCTDADNNSTDFSAGSPNPRNSASTSVSCSHTLNLTTSGSGSVAKLPDQAAYDFDSSVQLTATPATGWHFVGWSGDASGNTNPLSVAMDGDKNITATFAIDTELLSLTLVGSGSVAKLPDQASYDYGSSVQLTATPATGWHFVGWSGDASGNTNPLSVTMDGNKNITATFAIDQQTLAVTVVGSGSVAKLPDQATYDYGSSVQLTATPATGWHLVGWSGDASGNTNPLSVTMDGNKNITATFAIDQQTLAVTVVGSGSVAKLPDQATYDYGSSVQLTATPVTGWHFVGWSGDASGNTNPLSATMDGNKNITATFAIDQQVLTVTVVGSGTVAKLPDQPTYDYGASVQLTATPATGWHFVAWSGDESGNTNPLSVMMNGDKNITATFAIDQQVLTVTVVGSGTVAKLPDQANYDYGASVQLTATPATGWHFVGWSGDASGNTNPLSVTMNGDRNITATFAIDQQTLAVTVVGSGTVAKAPDQPTYDYGSSVQLTATPATGWHFVAWSGDATGNTNPLSVTMNGDRNITATFAIDQQTLAVTVVGSGTVAKAPDQPTYDYGSSVQLTATPATGWHFVAWSGDATGNTNPLPVTMNGDKNITATFAIDQEILALTLVGSGTVAKVPDQPTYDYGTIVQLTATPSIGSYFVGWSGDASGNTNPLNVTMDANKSITATFAVNTVVVSQVYGGGGNTGATYTNDFIELFNHGADPVDMTGWSVQYGAATGTAWSVTPISGVIQPGRYYLVQEAAGTGGTTPLPTPDVTGSIAMNTSAGKVALVSGATALSGACPSSFMIQDLVGYGSSANCSETSPAPAPSNTAAALRHASGCEDTDNNSLNFSTGAPTPRNSASPQNDCLFTLAVNVAPAASGSVAKSPNQASYASGSSVQLTATPVSGYHFDHWSGGASGSSNPLTLTVNADLTVTANFVLNGPISQIVISQVYGGGGNTLATLKNDFVELYNRGNVAVNVTGWAVQYASATGTSWSTTTLVGTIPPGRYYLVKEASGGGGSVDLPAADAIGTSNLGSTDGKVALTSDNTVLTGPCPSGGSVTDFIGYGTASCSETLPAAAADNLTAEFRGNDGCDETNNNLADFAGATPTPRNSATPVHVCDIWVGVDAPVAELMLAPPAPNPTHGMSRITFALPTSAAVRLMVLDVQGRRVASLVDGVMTAGRHDVPWMGRDDSGPVRPGLYFIRLEVMGRRFVRSMVVLR